MRFHWLFTSGKDTGHPPNPISNPLRFAWRSPTEKSPETPSISALRVVRIFAIDPPEKKVPAKKHMVALYRPFSIKVPWVRKIYSVGSCAKNRLKTNG